MILFFPFLIYSKKFLPYPYSTTPDPNDVFHRITCKGWACNLKLYPEHQKMEFDDTLDMYQNQTLINTVESKLKQLIRRDFHPAYCALGFFEMIGIAGITKNLTQSFIDLNEGSSYDIWSCHEILSYHPYTKDQMSYVRRAASKGAILSMIRLALETKNETESLLLLKHLATTQSSTWWKKRRSGIPFSDAISTILKLNDRNLTEAWKIIDDMSNENHLPASIWAAEGLQTGEIGRKNITEARMKLLPFVVNGHWKLDVAAMLKSTDEFDRYALLQIASLQGNKMATALLSYPKLFE